MTILESFNVASLTRRPDEAGDKGTLQITISVTKRNELEHKEAS